MTRVVRFTASSAFRIAALAAIGVLQLVWIRQPWPLSLKLIPLALAVLAVWRPFAGLLVFAALAPLKGEIWGALTGYATTSQSEWSAALVGTDLLKQLALAVLFGAAVRWRPSEGRLRLTRPALVFGAVAVASATAVLPSRVLASGPDASILDLAGQLWRGVDLGARTEWRPLVFALNVVVGLALACLAERAVREVPARAWSLIAASVAAHAALGAIAVALFIREAIQPATATSLPLSLLRISPLTDPNAAASVFVLTIIATAALIARNVRGLVLPGIAVALSAAGLLITGSRTALLALGVAVFIAGAVRWGPTAGTARRIVFGAAIAAFLAANVAILFYTPHRNSRAAFVAQTRWIVLRAGLRMTQAAPIFGVGTGTFWDRSVEFGTEDMLPLARTYEVRLYDAHENAHNNFIQVLAEQGVVGLLALGAVLASVLVPAARNPPRAPRTLWLVAGIGGYILTWFTGHPLLSPEAAFPFWLFFGVLSGLTPAPGTPSLRQRWMWIGLAALVISLPIRVMTENRTADFSHVGVGLSPWMQEPDGTEYRTAGAAFSLYVPTNRLVVIPIRRGPGAPGSLRIQVHADDRLVNEVAIEGTAWQDISLSLPSRHGRFRRVELTVRAEPPHPLAAGAVQIGRDRSRLP